jgi:zinc transport system permease protein
MAEIITQPFFQRALLAGLAIALVAGPLGCFIVWRRMAYFGETLAHSGLFGVGLGLLLGFSLTFGAVAAAVATALLLLALRHQRSLATDTLLGILSHVALALGLITVALVTGAAGDQMDLLFGDILSVTWRDVALVWICAVLVLGVLAYLARQWGFVLLETVWAAISAWSIVGRLREQSESDQY